MIAGVVVTTALLLLMIMMAMIPAKILLNKKVATMIPVKALNVDSLEIAKSSYSGHYAKFQCNNCHALIHRSEDTSPSDTSSSGHLLATGPTFRHLS